VEDEDDIVENEMEDERIEKNDDEKEIFIDIDNKNGWGINYFIIYLRKIIKNIFIYYMHN
jgi:hypothetical protein